MLHLIDADGDVTGSLVAGGAHYGEHRAAIWWGEDELVYIDGTGDTRSFGCRPARAPGSRSAGATARAGSLGARRPTARPATHRPSPTGASSDGVIRRPSLGGCQPAFSNDGRFGVWAAGAGGPIDAIELATRRTLTLLAKNDPRLPADRGYLYFPMLSHDGSLLAVAASDGEHDHFRADYDVFAIEVDPETARSDRRRRGRITATRPSTASRTSTRAARRAAPARGAAADSHGDAAVPAAAPGWPARTDAARAPLGGRRPPPTAAPPAPPASTSQPAGRAA